MNSFDSFVAELAAYEMGSAAPSQAPGPGPRVTPFSATISEEESHLLLQLRDDLLRAAMLVAVTAGIANALDKGRPRIGAYLLDVYVPRESPFVETLLDALRSTGVPLYVSRAIQSFTARLALSRRMTDAYITMAPIGGRVSQPVDAEILADAWRRTANAAVEAIDAINVALDGGGAAIERNPSTMTATLNLLHLAEAGETVCLDTRGRIAIPGWAERRREARVPLSLEATAIVGKIMFKASIRNASPMGLGLEGKIQGEPGARILVKFVGNRQLSGIIAWNDGQRLGIALDDRLGSNDPLLQRI